MITDSVQKRKPLFHFSPELRENKKVIGSLVKWTPMGRQGADAAMRPGTATITQIPKPAECSPMAALIPQAKESGEDSPSLPLIPSHLSPASPSAIFFTGTGGGGCVTLPADWKALAVSA